MSDDDRTPPSSHRTLWLVPAEPDRVALRSVIEDLAAQLGAPPFDPHVTLGEVDAPAVELAAALELVAERWPPVRLVAGPTDHGPERFTTLFVRFDDARVHAIARELHERLGASFDPAALRPHLSLAYRSDLPVGVREDLARHHTMTGRSIELDVIVAVEMTNGIDDVDGWEVTDEVVLHGSSEPPA